MKKYNLLTGKDRRHFALLRNGCLGSLHMATSSIGNMLNSDLVSPEDKINLKLAHGHISKVLKRWDKHYCAKLFAKLNEEANK